MKTEQLFKMIFKKVLENKDIEDISPSFLAMQIDKSKQSFYYHFRDLKDLVAWILIDDLKTKLDKSSTVEDFLNVLEMYRLENERFIKAIIESELATNLEEFITSSSTYFFNRYITNKYPDLRLEKRLLAAKYFSGALSSTYLLYLRDNRLKKSFEDIKKLFTHEEIVRLVKKMKFLNA